MGVSPEQLKTLQEKAKRVRIDILKMLTECGSGHTGGSLSAADIATRGSPPDDRAGRLSPGCRCRRLLFDRHIFRWRVFTMGLHALYIQFDGVLDIRYCFLIGIALRMTTREGRTESVITAILLPLKHDHICVFFHVRFLL